LPVDLNVLISVDFCFVTDGDEGRTFLASAEFIGPGASAFVVDAFVLRRGDSVVATATDASGNSSEFSAPIAIEFLDRVFGDDFELRH